MRNAVIIAAQDIPTFANTDDAWEWMYDEVDDPFIDNTRLAEIGNTEQEAKFEQQEREGCCGSFSAQINIAGRLHWIGCNYGH